MRKGEDWPVVVTLLRRYPGAPRQRAVIEEHRHPASPDVADL
jgi:hypothetical protein